VCRRRSSTGQPRRHGAWSFGIGHGRCRVTIRAAIDPGPIRLLMRASVFSALRRSLRLTAVWACLACVAFGLPLQALSAVLTDVLGPRHAHRTTASASHIADAADARYDVRRGHHEHRATSTRGSMPDTRAHAHARPNADARVHASARVHAHAHALGLRHHHALDDTTRVNLEASGDGEGAPSAWLQMGSGVVMGVHAGRLAPLLRPVALLDAAWRRGVVQPFTSALPRRIERPPRSV
jgi:hypothetical protein